MQEENWESLKPFIDVKDGLGRLMNNKDLYFKLLKNFDGKKYQEELEAVINNDNFEDMRHRAHTLKGVAANLSLVALAEEARVIESEAKDNKNASHLLENLKKTMDETLKAIATLTAV